MVSAVDVCNMALAQLGKPEITSMDERSTAAQWVRRAYDPARRNVLGRSDWVFARATAPLVGVRDASNPAFPYAYARPADFVKVRAVGDASEPYRRGAPWRGTPYELEGSVIRGLTPLSTLVYTRDVLDPDDWPEGFMEAVALKMASMIAMQATGRSDVSVNLQRLHENQLLLAIESDASQERRVWTDAEEDTICHDPSEWSRFPEQPFDETRFWVPGPAPEGTPVSAGGGAPPSEIVTIYEEGAGVDTDYVDLYDGGTGGTQNPLDGTPFDFVTIYEQAGGAQSPSDGTPYNFVTIYTQAKQ